MNMQWKEETNAFHVPENGCVLLKYPLSPIFKNSVYLLCMSLLCTQLFWMGFKQIYFLKSNRLSFPDRNGSMNTDIEDYFFGSYNRFCSSEI